MGRPRMHPEGSRELITLRLPDETMQWLREQSGTAPLSTTARNLIAESIQARKNLRADLSRMASIIREFSPIGCVKGNPMGAWSDWAMDIVKQLPAMPENPDYVEVIKFIGKHTR